MNSSRQNILEEAYYICNGPRVEAYGDAKESFTRVAAIWSVLLGKTISATEVLECMIALKLVRENNAHKKDNLVDICGYSYLIEQIENQKEEK